jgi:hypothetical protein
MPIYSFQDNETGEVKDEIMSYEDKLKYLDENPHLTAIITKAPAIGSHRGGDRTKPPGGFKDVLSRVADANPYSALADDYGKKDSTKVKLRETVKGVKKKVGDIYGVSTKEKGAV